MAAQETFGLENLGIDGVRPLGKHARRKARAKARLREQENALHEVPKHDFGTDGTTEQHWGSPTIHSYQPLPIPPLGSQPLVANRKPGLNNDIKHQDEPGVAQDQPCRDHVPDEKIEIFNKYNSGQGFTSVNPPSAIQQPSTWQRLQGGVPLRGSAHSSNGLHDNSTARLHEERHAVPISHLYKLPASSHRPSSTAVQSNPAIDYTQPRHPWIKKRSSRDELIPLPAPIPTPTYMILAHAPPTILHSPRRLLLILDLNGTLLHRSTHIQFTPRPHLKQFLSYALANHSILIWSSAQPKNVNGMCEKMFTPAQRKMLLGEWGRDTLDLTPEQYKERVQVFKRLEKIWESEMLQRTHPEFYTGQRWGQHNTLLIDDSFLKASGQPFNHVEVPEFFKDGDKKNDPARVILAQVVGFLEAARQRSDVSAFVRDHRFKLDDGWRWDWTQGQGQKSEDLEDEDDDDEGGGVALDGFA